MQVYQPIDVGVSIVAVSSDLVAFQWQVNGIVADFVIPSDDTHVLRISFDRQCIVRILDEMPLSTEADSANSQGLVSNQFAYKVRGSTFEATQSPSWREISGPVSHYQFITGWACMDVLSAAEPSFSVVPRIQKAAEQHHPEASPVG